MKNILRSMKLWQKFAALGVIGAVMTAIPALKVLEYKTAEASVAQSEDNGLDPARTAISMMRAMQQHRGLSGIALNGSAAVDGERRALRAEVGKSMDTLLKQVQDFGYKDTTAEVQSLKAEWEKLVAQVDAKSISAADSFSAHSRLIDHALRSIESVADASGLSLDPVAETYFVMTASMDHLPRLTEAMARLRGLGAAMLGAKEISAQERARLAHLAEQSHYLLDRANAQFAKASEIRPSMKKALDGVAAAHDEATKFFTLAEKELMGSTKPTLAAADFFRAGTTAVDAQYQLIEVANHALEEALHERIHDTTQARLMLLALLGGLSLLAAGLGVAIMRSVTRPLGHAVDAANAVAAGNLEFAIDAGGQDEAARLLGRFADMQVQLRQRRAEDEQRRVDAEAAALAATQVAEEIGEAVDGATQGDFTRRIATEGKEAFHASLCGKFNELIDTVSGTIREVRAAADQLGAASGQVSQTSQSLSHSASQQAASVEETTASLQEMSASVKGNADSATVSDGIDTKDAREAADGGAAVSLTVDAM